MGWKLANANGANKEPNPKKGFGGKCQMVGCNNHATVMIGKMKVCRSCKEMAS